MDLKAILFDINGTLSDIRTDEGMPEIYYEMSKFFAYHKTFISAEELRDRYFSLLHLQLEKSGEHPEFDAEKIFNDIISKSDNKSLAATAAVMYRSLSLKQLKLYDYAQELLDSLKGRYKLGAVTDGQSLYAKREMDIVGISGYFNSVIVSGDYGYRKPDRRMFETAMEQLKVKPEQCLFVGNDIYTDIYGAQNCKIKAVMFYSNQGRQHLDNVFPDYSISSLRELPAVIGQLLN